MDKGNATPTSKSSKRKLTKCDIRLIAALLEDAANRPKLDGVDGKTKAGIRPVLQTKACKELADFMKTKQQLTTVRKRSKSLKEKKTKTKLTRDDILLVCTWLEGGDNRSKVHGVDGSTQGGVRPVDRAKAYKELADFVYKNRSKDSTLSPIPSHSMQRRFCYMLKRFCETRELAKSRGFGLTDKDRNMNVSTIQDKLENLCPGFNRLGAMFGFPPIVNPDVTEQIGVGVFGIFPVDSNNGAADREMDYGTDEKPVMIRKMSCGIEENPVRIETVGFGQDEDNVEKTAPPSIVEKTRRVEDEDGRLQLQHAVGEYQLAIQQIEDDPKKRTQEDREAEQAIVKMNLQIAMISSHRPLDELKEILKICEF